MARALHYYRDMSNLLESAEWFPLNSHTVAAKLYGYTIECGGSGNMQLFAVKSDGMTALFWQRGCSLFSHDHKTAVVGAYHDYKNVRKVTKGHFTSIETTLAKIRNAFD